jgi:hypothetical protein
MDTSRAAVAHRTVAAGAGLGCRQDVSKPGIAVAATAAHTMGHGKGDEPRNEHNEQQQFTTPVQTSLTGGRKPGRAALGAWTAGTRRCQRAIWQQHHTPAEPERGGVQMRIIETQK